MVMWIIYIGDICQLIIREIEIRLFILYGDGRFFLCKKTIGYSIIVSSEYNAIVAFTCQGELITMIGDGIFFIIQSREDIVDGFRSGRNYHRFVSQYFSSLQMQ